MRVLVFGIRGFPGIEGGVENHAENLYPLLVRLGCDVEVVVRSPYWRSGNGKTWRGVRLLPIWAPVSSVKGLEAFVHSFLSVCVAGLKRPQVLHIHALGPSLMAPLARLFGLRVVITNHGPDYESDEWGSFAKVLLETAERIGMRFAHKRIAISQVVKDIVGTKHRCDAVVIPNGVCVEGVLDTRSALDRFDLKPGRYVLLVSRFAAHKNHPDLIRAFESAALPGWKLVLVGRCDSRDTYTRYVLSLAGKNPTVIFTGYQGGKALKELYAHAGVFVLPSAYEGLPIAILEALSFGLPVLASDILAHLEIGLPSEQYFPLGDTVALAQKLREFSTAEFSKDMRRSIRDWVRERYDWGEIARQTLEVYHETCSPKYFSTSVRTTLPNPHS